MKKIAIILFALITVFAFAGCQNEIKQDEPEITVATDDDIKLLSYYMRSFGHDRILGDTDAILKGAKVDGLKADTAFDDEKGTLTFTVTLDGYDYDGHKDNDMLGIYQRLATGTMTVTYTGKLNEGKTEFSADKAVFTDVDGTLSVDYASSFPVDSITVTCEEATATFTDKDKTEASAVVFTVADGKVNGIGNVGEVSFKLSAVDGATINGRNVEDSASEPAEPDTEA